MKLMSKELKKLVKKQNKLLLRIYDDSYITNLVCSIYVRQNLVSTNKTWKILDI